MPKAIDALETHYRGSSRYDLKMVCCGKPNCGRCPHGPYWYVTIQLRSGKAVRRYLGKERPAEVPEPEKTPTGARSAEVQHVR
jgi:hypothetical protein